MLAALVVLSVAAVACGGNVAGGGSGGGGPSGSDLTLSQVFQDLAPAVCQKLSQCNSAGFASAFAGESGCESYFESQDPNPTAVVFCTQDQATQCGQDIEGAPCDQVFPPGGGKPTLPASCNGC